MKLYVVSHASMSYPAFSDVGFFQDRLKNNYKKNLLSETSVHAFKTIEEALNYARSLKAGTIEVPVYSVLVDDNAVLDWQEIEICPQTYTKDRNADTIARGDKITVSCSMLAKTSMQTLEKVQFPGIRLLRKDFAERDPTTYQGDEGKLEHGSSFCVIQ